MDDLIRRSDAIEYFMTNTNWHDEEGYPIDDAEDKRALLTDYFNGVQSAQQWIPVTERLPEELLCDDGYVEPSNPVLICFSNGAVLISRYWGNRRSKIERPVDYLNWTDQPSWRQDPIAWMPLPEPYKAEKE